MISRNIGFYEKYIKRVLDIVCVIAALVFFGWLYIVIAVLVRVNMGSPVLFRQPRPGIIVKKTGTERIFYMYKFRTMTNEKDENGNILPDELRVTKFGKWLRASSLDELPEALNILKGDMSIIGPRPQLVRDMVFMTPEQRMRHTAKPGLSGLAQVSGINALSWDSKLRIDLQYIKQVCFVNDLKIVFMTIKKVFFNQNMDEFDKEAENAITEDYGDYLLRLGRITKEEYLQGQMEAEELINRSVQ